MSPEEWSQNVPHKQLTPKTDKTHAQISARVVDNFSDEAAESLSLLEQAGFSRAGATAILRDLLQKSSYSPVEAQIRRQIEWARGRGLKTLGGLKTAILEDWEEPGKSPACWTFEKSSGEGGEAEEPGAP